jgi:hypothetical protein
MQVHLQRLYGEDWESQLASTAGGNRSPTRGVRRSSSNLVAAMLGSIPPSVSQPPPQPPLREEGRSVDDQTPVAAINANASTDGLQQQQQHIDPHKLLGHLECVRLLVQGMERRLIERGAELDEKEKKALTQTQS